MGVVGVMAGVGGVAAAAEDDEAVSSRMRFTPSPCPFSPLHPQYHPTVSFSFLSRRLSYPRATPPSSRFHRILIFPLFFLLIAFALPPLSLLLLSSVQSNVVIGCAHPPSRSQAGKESLLVSHFAVERAAPA